MSYIPELRASVVQAAAQRASAGEPALRARRRPPLAGIGLVLASATAIAVAGLALVLASHRPGRPAGGPGGPATPVTIAHALLAQVRVPAGAVPISRDVTSPATLSAPFAGLPAPRAVDLHRFWRVHGEPNTVADEVQVLGIMTTQPARGPTSGTGAWPTGATGLSTETVVPSAEHGMGREIQIAAARLPGGDSEVRVDVLAWYPVPGFARDRMPGTAADIIVFRTTSGPHSRIPGSAVLLHRASIEEIIRFIKSLRALGAGAPVCHPEPPDLLTFGFDHSHLSAQARVEPACARVELSINGEPPDQLTWIGAPVSTQTVNRFLALVVGRG